jgi:RHS repeat-associated protein
MYRGIKRYELSNHLGNVLAVISDKLLPNVNYSQDGDTQFGTKNHLFTADVVTATDYYAFGMVMPGRSFEVAGAYRYGFNGKEKEDGINIDNYDFGARIYDGRVGRWLSVDPLAIKYPGDSPFIFGFNTPISFRDSDGNEPVRVWAGTIQQAIVHLNSKGLRSVNDIYDYYGKYQEGAEAPNGFVRYVYTEKKGWIDLRHYFGSLKHGELLMDALEYTQDYNDYPSAWSYEDLPSNDFGGNSPIEKIIFCDLCSSTSYVLLEGQELYKALEEHFVEASATNPENAPNWRKIPENKTRMHTDTDSYINDGRYVFQNHSEEPADLSNFPAAPDSIENQEK